MKEINEQAQTKQSHTPQQIAKEIERLAAAGELQKATKVRNHLLKHHPMALTEIVATAEIIEEQMTARIDRDHLAAFAALYDDFTNEERNTLFYSTRKVTVPKGKVLMRQGTTVARLFFIEKGRVTLFHQRTDEKIMVGQLSHGDILGEETFFHFSTPTLSAGSQTDVQLRYLEKSTTDDWEDSCPGLLRRLADYCLRSGRAMEMLRSKNIEKRAYQRVKLKGKVQARFNEEQAHSGRESFRGSVADLSRNGISFDIHVSKPEYAFELVGLELQLEIELEAGEKKISIALAGTVVKITALMHNDFLVHVHLSQVIPAEKFSIISQK